MYLTEIVKINSIINAKNTLKNFKEQWIQKLNAR